MTMTETTPGQTTPAETPARTPAAASQTAGPYWHLIDFPEWADTTRFLAEATAPRIVLTGTLTDGAGNLVSDAMVEIWHAAPDGSYPGPGSAPDAFQGYGRCATDAEGRYRFATLRPGPVPGPGNAMQAPHVAMSVFARGLLCHLSTRLYFDGEPLNATDPVLAMVPPERHATLLARESAPGTWSLDLRLQGEGETAWMEI